MNLFHWHWSYIRFSKRHREFLTSDGSFDSKMPPHLENRIATFRAVLSQLQREKQFPAYQVSIIIIIVITIVIVIIMVTIMTIIITCGMYQVGAMDELCIHWSQVQERRGGGSGVLRHHGMDTSSCSIMLAATADGNLLPPFLILKVNLSFTRMIMDIL